MDYQITFFYDNKDNERQKAYFDILEFAHPKGLHTFFTPYNKIEGRKNPGVIIISGDVTTFYDSVAPECLDTLKSDIEKLADSES